MRTIRQFLKMLRNLSEILAVLLLAAGAMAHAQVSNPSVIYVSSAPSGSCASAPPLQTVISTGTLYTCNNGTWAAISSGGGTTTNALTANSSGGAAPGSTFNGASAVTFDYHSFGAAPLASPTFTGTETTAPAINVPSGATLTIQSGGTLTCAAGSTCPAAAGSLTGTSLTAYNVYYMSGSALTNAEANSASTLPGICVASSTTVCVYSGVVTNGSWTWTQGQVIYVSDSSAGGLTATAPSTSGHFVQIVGVATSATTLLVMPSLNILGIQ